MIMSFIAFIKIQKLETVLRFYATFSILAFENAEGRGELCL